MIGNDQCDKSVDRLLRDLVLPGGNQGLLKGSPEKSFLSRSAMTPLKLALQPSFLRPVQPVRDEENPDQFLDGDASLNCELLES